MAADYDCVTLDRLMRLAYVGERWHIAEDLARCFGGETLLMFVRDPAIDVLVPAPGFPQTVRGGPSWREFLRGLRAPGRQAGEVEMPPGRTRAATALVIDGAAAVLLGPAGSDHADLDLLGHVMPLLAACFGAEQRAALAEAQACEAEKAARRTRALVDAVESTRAEAWRLNAELTQQHSQRDDFLAMLAHELRNPLAPLVTSVALLRRSGAEAVASLIDIMDRQLRQLSRMVDDLLDVSRVKHGKIELRREPVMLRDSLQAAIEATRPMFDARGHALELHLPDEPLVVDADNMRLTQVLSNLLHNAAKYTDPCGRIKVHVFQDGGEAVVRIEDNGVGIAPEVLPQVFDLFVQAPVGRDRAQGGLGIGLTLVRSLVELHGGRVAAFSDGRDQGSRFEVHLPLHVGPVPVRDQPVSIVELDSGSALRILVVDDNRDLTESLAMLLRIMGHKVDIAHSGWHALQVAEDIDPDVVLLDIGLPDLDGHEAGRRLRRIIRSDASVIAMTGYGSEEDRRRSADAGFSAHLVKPIEPEQLAALLAELPRAARAIAGGP